MSATIKATVGDVVGGRYPEGTLVTVAGRVNIPTWRTTAQGNPWVTFYLTSPLTAVQVDLQPAQYEAFGDLLGPTLADYRPQRVTITGRIAAGSHCQPAVVVTDVERHTDEPCESLENMRRHSAMFDEMLRGRSKQEANR